MYIDKLDDIVNKYNNTYHSTIKIKPVDVKSNTYNKLMVKILNIKLEIILEYQIIKTFCAKGYVPNWFKEVLLLQKLKILFRGHMLLVILMEKKLLERFTKKNCKKCIKKSLELKK